MLHALQGEGVGKAYAIYPGVDWSTSRVDSSSSSKFAFAVAPVVYTSGTLPGTAMGHRMSFIIVADGPWVIVP